VSLKLADRDLDLMLKSLNDLMKTVNGDMFILEKQVGYGWKLHRQTSSPNSQIELVSPNYFITKNMMWNFLVNTLTAIQLQANQTEVTV
jgi:hypothetical protein